MTRTAPVRVPLTRKPVRHPYDLYGTPVPLRDMTRTATHTTRTRPDPYAGPPLYKGGPVSGGPVLGLFEPQFQHRWEATR